MRDSPGFATSRLGVALGLEAMRMVEEGVATASDIDRAMEAGYGHAMGPLKTSDLVGLDVRLAIADALVRELSEERFRPPALSLAIADALGLALFTVSGAQIAESRGLSGVVVVLMGTLTGVAGGVLRDVLAAEIPMILRKGQLYATASIAGAAAYLLLQSFLDRTAAALVAMAFTAALRIAAIVWDLTLPVFTLARHDRGHK